MSISVFTGKHLGDTIPFNSGDLGRKEQVRSQGHVCFNKEELLPQ